MTLEYEAFDEMAVKKLEEVRQELMAEFGLDDVAIGHRTGTVAIGEISLVVAIGSPHRKDGFYACHKAVDRIKEVVPIWKKEVYEDGSRWVACEDHEFTHEHEDGDAGGGPLTIKSSRLPVPTGPFHFRRNQPNA